MDVDSLNNEEVRWRIQSRRGIGVRSRYTANKDRRYEGTYSALVTVSERDGEIAGLCRWWSRCKLLGTARVHRKRPNMHHVHGISRAPVSIGIGEQAGYIISPMYEVKLECESTQCVVFTPVRTFH